MKFQIIVTPCMASSQHTDTPFGALYIGASLIEEGHEVRIENCDVEKFDYAELSKRIKQYRPDVIGISGVIVIAYKYIKETTLLIKKEFPNIKIIVGGGVSSAAELLLRNSGADIVVIGEGDITIKELAQRIAQGKSYCDVAGIAFKEGDAIVKTQPKPPIMNLDILKYPEFDLIDMSKYLLELKDSVLSHRHYKNPDKRLFYAHRSKKMLRILLSRGCISRCSFCYRPTTGLRHFSFGYIFDYIEYLMEKFNINIFSIGDECFSPSKAWNWRFLDELHKRKLDILFQIMGMRVDTVDYGMLRAFKEAGCFQIFYGFESGSQQILDIMDKRISVEQNLQAAQWTKQAGIYTCPNILLGMPGETTETVKESIDFLKKLNLGPRWYQYVYPIAVPETPLCDYAKTTGLILDEDKYLESLYYTNSQEVIDTNAFINFTSEKFETVKNWPHLVRDELFKYYFKNKIVYIIEKYLRLDDFSYSLRKFGLKKTLQKIKDHLFKRKRGLEHIYSPVVQEPSSERDRYLGIVNRFIDNNTKRFSLRQIVKQIKDKQDLNAGIKNNEKMTTEQLLSDKYIFRENFIPQWLTSSQLSARKLFLDEVHNKKRYINITECPYCSNRSFKIISKVNKRGLPSDIVICNFCEGCFKSTILNLEATRYYYEEISHILVGKSFSQDKLETRFNNRVRLFAYPRYRFISHFLELDPKKNLIAEFGCNDGANLVPWKENGFSIIGIDLEPRLVQFGKKKGLNLVKADMLDYDFGERKPKLIIISHVLDRVDNVNALLKRIKDTLDSGGYLFIETQGIKSHGLINPMQYFDVESNYYFDLDSIATLLKKYLFKIIYADGYIRILCTPEEDASVLPQRAIPLSLDKIKASLFKSVINTMNLKNKNLYDLLKAGEKGYIQIKIFNKIQRLYFRSLFKSLQKKVKTSSPRNKREQPRGSPDVAKRFIEEELGIHWQVDETKESLERLLRHLQIKTNFKPYFEETIGHLGLDNDKFKNGIVAADIGAGVCWTSALLAKHSNVKFVYAVDPSQSRLKHARFVIKHFGVEDKVKIIQGTFLEPNIPQGVDLILLCGSLHHCFDKQLEGLFLNMKRMLNKGGVVLIINEHYVNRVWILKQLLSYFRHFSNRKNLYYCLSSLRTPHPFSSEHWRTREELEKIFRDFGFTAQFYIHNGDLCKDKPTFYHRLGWHYYHAILRLRDELKS